MILITGGAGFIGINFVHYLREKNLAHKILVADKLTYSANAKDIQKLKDIKFEIVDIADKAALEELFKKYYIDSIVNFAAETHVDNSIENCDVFVQSNIVGTVNLLQLAKKYTVRRFLHVSTDEVFGSIEEGDFNEHSPIAPRNPYSASKAAAEHFVKSFSNTYGLPTVIVNCSNNYGPYQHTEKFVARAIDTLRKGGNIPVYGNGQQVRDWIYVKDCVRAIYEVHIKGRIGERYCIGGDSTITNLDLARLILKEMNLSDDRLEFVADRPGHDQRYSTDCSKLKDELGWKAEFTLDQGIKETIRWINENRI